MRFVEIESGIRMKQIIKHSLVGAAAMMLVACGGGGDDAGSCKYGTSCNANAVDGTGVSKVSTTQATQKSMSFSAEDYQLDWSIDGKESTVTIRVADTAGNPLPAGTVIQFSVSGGQIEKTCTTGNATDGSSGCTVSFTTANPRPANGLVSVVAWLVGEESYKDLNGNGKYDQGEPFYESGTLFRDDDGSGDYTPNVDEIVVSNTLSDSQIGVGTSACRQDSQAEPTEIPLSVPNSCDGVWGKTLVRSQAYFAVSDPRNLDIETATTNNAGQSLSGSNWVRVFTRAPDGTSKVAAVSGTTVSVAPASGTLPANCSLSILPSTSVSSTAVLPTYHRVAISGPSCVGESVIVTATSGAFSQQVSLTLQ